MAGGEGLRCKIQNAARMVTIIKYTESRNLKKGQEKARVGLNGLQSCDLGLVLSLPPFATHVIKCRVQHLARYAAII